MDLAIRQTLDVPRPVRGIAVAATEAISIVSDRGAFEALAPDWRRLEEEGRGAILFQSFEWCRTVWDHWAAERRDFAPRIVVARRGGSTAAILPLRIVRLGGLRLAIGFGEPFQQYSEVLLAAGEGTDLAEAMLRDTAHLLKVDGLQLLKVREDSALLPALKRLAPIRSNEDAAPYVDLAAFEDFDAYYATVNAKTRKNMRNARNRLGRAGELRHDILQGPDAEQLVQRAYEGRERWLAEQGLTSRAFRDPSFAAFVTRATASESGLSTMMMSLTLDGRPLADQWGFVHAGRYYAFAATWDPAFEESSPGKLHLGDVIRACADWGIGLADFLMPAVRYKFTWTDSAMPVADYAVPLTLKGRLYLSLWSGKVRPLLKHMALRMPRSIRSRITGAVLPRG